MADDNRGASDVDTDIVWTVDNEMILETVFGIALTIISGGDTKADPVSLIYKGIVTTNNIIEKENNKEMDDSIHEELHQLAKDTILKMGGNK